MPIDKTTEEWLVMRYFREKYLQFPKGKLIKTESPDFILRVNRRKRIGIELTRLDYLLKDVTNKNELSGLLRILIAQKEEKLPLYRKNRLSEYWLIVSSDSLKIGLPEHLILNSKFDKVFLIDLFSGLIVVSEG